MNEEVQHPVVSKSEWLEARQKLLAKEKTMTRLQDELSQERRRLPWVRIDKEYLFEGPDGIETLADLFEGHSQLVIYHFMFGPDDDAGCKHCSLRADGFDGINIHLKHRDVTMIAVSRAPYAKLAAYRKRMGWGFKWVSSGKSDFNFDFHVSFTPEELAKKEAFFKFMGFSGDRVAATMLLQTSDPVYWPDAAPNTALYLHKIAVRREFAGRGWLTRLIEFAVNDARDRGVRWLRLDTVCRSRLEGLYARHGFAALNEPPIANGCRQMIRMEREL